MNTKIPAQYILLQNKIRGKIAEEIAKLDYENHGYSVIRTGIGSDFKVSKNAFMDHIEYVDVKFGMAKLTKTQKKTRTELRKSGFQYSIYHVTPGFLEYQINQNKRLQNMISNSMNNLDKEMLFLTRDHSFIENIPHEGTNGGGSFE